MPDRRWFAPVSFFLMLLLAGAAAAQKGDTNTRTLNGQVFDKGGSPVERAVVHLKNAKTLQVRTYISTPDGSFRFHGLTANTDYQVHAEHEGATSAVKTISSFDDRKEINITLRIEPKK